MHMFCFIDVFINLKSVSEKILRRKSNFEEISFQNGIFVKIRSEKLNVVQSKLADVSQDGCIWSHTSTTQI